MSIPLNLWHLLLALLAGGLLGFVIGFLVVRVRADRLGMETASRLSAAEAVAQSERTRREDLEVELRAVERLRAGLDRDLAVAAERTSQADQLIEAQRDFIETSRKELETTFRALAASALEGNNRRFLELAEQSLGRSQAQGAAQLDRHSHSMQSLLDPLRESLGRLEGATGEMEKARVDAYSKIDERVQRLAQVTAELQERTTSLSTALRGAESRGRWGEVALRNVVEMAGMTEHCDFEEQTGLSDGGRPDMVVNLPGGRFIAVDAKAPLAAYLAASEATRPEDRDAELDRHLRDVKTHIKTLSGREYAAALPGDLDLVVLFLPGDAFLSAAFARDPNLQNEALRSKVLIATPTTLIALLRTVAIYWQQRSLAENAERIAATARELYERSAMFARHLGKVGRGLNEAVDSYNDAVGSFERRLMPMARQLESLKASEGAKRQLKIPVPLEERPREVSGPESYT